MSTPVSLFHTIDGKTIIAQVEISDADGFLLYRACEVVPMRKDPHSPIELGFVPYLTLGNLIPAAEKISLSRLHVILKRPAPKDLEDGYRSAVSGIILK